MTWVNLGATLHNVYAYQPTSHTCIHVCTSPADGKPKVLAAWNLAIAYVKSKDEKTSLDWMEKVSASMTWSDTSSTN